MRLSNVLSSGLFAASVMVAGLSFADVPGGAGGTGGTASTGGSGGSASDGEESSGCSVSNTGAPIAAGAMSGLALLGLVMVSGARRKSRKSR